MAEMEQFLPAEGKEGLDKDQWRQVVAIVRPDITDDQFVNDWSGFLAMKERVNNPRRRQGNDVRRIGAVLFDPVHYARRAPDE